MTHTGGNDLSGRPVHLCVELLQEIVRRLETSHAGKVPVSLRLPYRALRGLGSLLHTLTTTRETWNEHSSWCIIIQATFYKLGTQHSCYCKYTERTASKVELSVFGGYKFGKAERESSMNAIYS